MVHVQPWGQAFTSINVSHVYTPLGFGTCVEITPVQMFAETVQAGASASICTSVPTLVILKLEVANDPGVA